MNKGKVYLIGAGPGDPGLLTCRAKQLLSECDVVCYDKLVSAAILSVVPEHVQLHQVGYRGYQGTHIDYGMHPDVMAFARAGKRVARLKAGDPCIFGRTTEECRELNDNQIPYEIVPGITAALGAAAYSGFPLTSGGVASSVTFVSGHKHSRTIASWSELGRAGGTLVLYMGTKRLAEHTENLIANGRQPDTPIAVICSATSAAHQCITGTLATIAAQVDMSEMQGPALIVVGDVVAQGRELEWRSKLPLPGIRFLICGSYEETNQLRASGAEVIQVDSLPVRSLLASTELEFLSAQPGLGFDDLAAFRNWWQAVQDHGWDIRRFSMPMGSRNRLVRQALKKIGIQAETLSFDATILTLNEEKASEQKGAENYYLVGSYRSEPLRYPVPPVEWVLVEDINIFKSVAQHHPDALGNAQLVALNDEVREWAIANGYLTENAQAPEFIQRTEVIYPAESSGVAGCFDVVD